MNVTRKSRRALSRIHAAIQGVTGYAYNADPAGAGGGGGGSTEPAKGQQQPAAGKPDGDDGKLTLTKAELDAQIAAAVKAQQDKADAKAKKEREDAEAAEAQKRGEFEKVAATEKSKREAAEAERDALKRERAVERALTTAAAGHDGYPLTVFTEYVQPKLLTTLAPDADDAAIAKAAKEAVEKYVADNPRQPKGGAGAQPATARASSRLPAGRGPNGQTRSLPAAASYRLNF